MLLAHAQVKPKGRVKCEVLFLYSYPAFFHVFTKPELLARMAAISGRRDATGPQYRLYVQRHQ